LLEAKKEIGSESPSYSSSTALGETIENRSLEKMPSALDSLRKNKSIPTDSMNVEVADSVKKDSLSFLSHLIMHHPNGKFK